MTLYLTGMTFSHENSNSGNREAWLVDNAIYMESDTPSSSRSLPPSATCTHMTAPEYCKEDY